MPKPICLKDSVYVRKYYCIFKLKKKIVDIKLVRVIFTNLVLFYALVEFTYGSSIRHKGITLDLVLLIKDNTQNALCHAHVFHEIAFKDIEMEGKVWFG